MGAPTKTQIEAWTDNLAARIQLALNAFNAEYTPSTTLSLFDLVDASGDPDVETSLGSKALALDRAAYPEVIYTALSHALTRSEWADFARAIRTLVTGSTGGNYASFRAYLVAVGAKIHPLAGELFRRSVNEQLFTASSVVRGVSNPLYAMATPTLVYTGADGSLTDDTTDATSSATADVTLFASDNHTLYIGLDRKFDTIVVALSTVANATITPTFQYWNGSAWTTLTVTDNTSGFTRNDTITFTAPTDWSRGFKDGGGTNFAQTTPLYYVRIARTADSLATPPVGTCITVSPTYVPLSSGSSYHLGVPQPPLAICRITAANTMTVTAPAAIDHTRFAEPVGTENKIRLRALTPIGNNLTVTLAYVNSSAANASTAQSEWTAPAALGTATVALTSTDALRSVRTASTVVTSATSGVFAVEALPIRDPAI